MVDRSTACDLAIFALEFRTPFRHLNASSVQPELPHPTRPNAHWRTIRVLLRPPFSMLFGLRARGFENLPTGGALLLINHQSYLDPLLVGAPLLRPVSYLARDDLFKVPFVSWIIRNTYVMPISREAAGSASIREAIRRIHHGFYVGIFPEGTRSVDGSLAELKPGFLMLARMANVPVIPVGVAGAYRVFPKNSMCFRPGSVRIVYGPPLPSEWFSSRVDKDAQRELLQNIHDRMQAVLDEANAWRDRLLSNTNAK